MVLNLFKYFALLSILSIITSTHAISQGDSSPGSGNYPQLRIVGFIQQQYIADYTTGNSSEFTIHRARGGVAGRLTERISVNFVVGAVEPPDRSPQLVNAIADVDLHPLANIRIGQFLVPFGLEGPEVITFNPAIERSITIRRLNTFRMFRDVGVQLGGRYSMFSYALAVVNGTGANPTENTPDNDYLARFIIEPVHNFEIGISGHLGHFQSQDDESRRRYRGGLHFQFDHKPFMARGEYIIREDEYQSESYRRQTGGYILGGIWVSDNWKFIGRIERHDPDTSIDNIHYTGITIGGNYYIRGRTRISANYEFRTDNNFPDPGNLFTVQMQVAL